MEPATDMRPGELPEMATPQAWYDRDGAVIDTPLLTKVLTGDRRWLAEGADELGLHFARRLATTRQRRGYLCSVWIKPQEGDEMLRARAYISPADWHAARQQTLVLIRKMTQ